jgi:hypothetical protein
MSHIEYFSLAQGSEQVFGDIDGAMRALQSGHCGKSEVLQAYQRLVESNGLERFLENTLETIASSDDFAPLWISGTECPIIANASSVLSLRCFALANEIDAIYAAPGDLVLTLLSNQPITVEIYHPVEDGSRQRLHQAITLTRGASIEIANGHAFRLAGGMQPALLARLLLGLTDYTAVYHSKTLDFISMLSLNPSNSRWAFMAQVAALFETQAAIPILEKLTRHGDYDVRWKALQGLFEHDTERAFHILGEFRNDPSEHISAQAKAEYESIRLQMSMKA